MKIVSCSRTSPTTTEKEHHPIFTMTKDSKIPDTCVETAISTETKQLAETELREDEASREDGINQIRQWVKKNSRIESCRLGER